MHPLAKLAPFRCSVTDGELPVTVEGDVPAELAGRLIRTTPAGLSTDTWQAAHWFDGLCLLYRFDIGERPGFRARWMDSEFSRQCHSSHVRMTSFGTRRNPRFLDWLCHPKPPVTDNCNVNILCHGDDVLALTETQHSLQVDPQSLAVTGSYVYSGDVPRSAANLAHPRFHRQRGEVVTICSRLGPTSEVFVTAMKPGSGERTRLNSWVTSKWPYIHDFGLTEHYAILVAHPFSADVRKMLWSRSGLNASMSCDRGAPTRLIVLPLDGGEPAIVETEPGFVFHLYNSFESDGKIVMDVIEHQGEDVLDKLYLDSLAQGSLTLGGRPLRLRVDIASKRVEREYLADTLCEFPQINYRDRHLRNYRFGYSLSVDSQGSGEQQRFESAVLKFDFESGRQLRYGEEDWIPGEALFVPASQAGGEDDGYLLTVASHRSAQQTSCWILDAHTLQPRAKLTVDTSVPLGFHGQFIGDR